MGEITHPGTTPVGWSCRCGRGARRPSLDACDQWTPPQHRPHRQGCRRRRGTAGADDRGPGRRDRDGPPPASRPARRPAQGRLLPGATPPHPRRAGSRPARSDADHRVPRPGRRFGGLDGHDRRRHVDRHGQAAPGHLRCAVRHTRRHHRRRLQPDHASNARPGATRSAAAGASPADASTQTGCSATASRASRECRRCGWPCSHPSRS